MDARNHWQPVTDVYQQIIETAAVASLDGDPMVLIEAARRANKKTEVRVPFGISAIATLFMLRAAVYGLFAAKLLLSPSSEIGYWITAHCPVLIPIGFGKMDSKALPTTMAEALGVMAVLSLGIGLLWILHWKPVLIVSLALSGYTLVHIAISYFGMSGLGDPNLFAPQQIDLLVVEGALSVLTFFFIALYPNLKQHFHNHF